MPKVVAVSFRPAGKVYYFSPGELEVKEGQKVLAETGRGLEFGEVVQGPREVPEGELNGPPKPLLRVATPEDWSRQEANREREADAVRLCMEKIAEHGLPMKLTGARYTFDRRRLVFYFTAASRVDFRKLVRELASMFRTRIELRQIGVRDEAKIVGGLGPCGRELCCGRFLRDFEPVAIRMAKSQGLALNPSKISGVCGRLMCCLRYESETYEHGRRALPKVGSIVATPVGEGKVTDLNVLRQTVRVQIPERGPVEVAAADLACVGGDSEAKAPSAQAQAPPPPPPQPAEAGPGEKKAGEQGRRRRPRRRRRRRRGRGRKRNEGQGGQSRPSGAE